MYPFKHLALLHYFHMLWVMHEHVMSHCTKGPSTPWSEWHLDKKLVPISRMSNFYNRFFKQRLIYLYTSKYITSVSSLQILNPIWWTCPAVLNCNLSIRWTLSPEFSASCLKLPAPPHIQYKVFISLTAPRILPSSQTGSQALRLLRILLPKPPLHLAWSVFS